MLIGCASAPKSSVSLDFEEESGSSITKINSELQTSIGSSAREYRLGFGDRVDLLVYQVPKLSREYQINSKGEIQIPLIGASDIGGLTVDQAQSKIKQTLESTIMLDPQVTLSIIEYGANEVSVTGAVRQPDLYKIKEGRNPFEMLTIAGGLGDGAGRHMHITTRKRNIETDQLETVRIVVDLESHFNPKDPEDFENQRKLQNLVLKDGDNVYVPKAGLVYIDGGIKKPGSYEINADTTIQSLIALAGGANWSSSQRKVKVVRKVGGESQINVVNLAREKVDFVLKAGDLVVVGHNPIKRGLEGFFQYGLRLVFLL